VVRCDGTFLVKYESDIIEVLRSTLHFKCKEVQQLASSLLRNVLKLLTVVYTLNCRSVSDAWKTAGSDHPIPIRVSGHWKAFLFWEHNSFQYSVSNTVRRVIRKMLVIWFHICKSRGFISLIQVYHYNSAINTLCSYEAAWFGWRIYTDTVLSLYLIKWSILIITVNNRWDHCLKIFLLNSLQYHYFPFPPRRHLNKEVSSMLCS